MATRLLEAIERWASESDDRAQLVIFLIIAFFGAIVLVVVAVLAVWLLPPQAWPF